MMRRAMEGQRVFGMSSWTTKGSASTYGKKLFYVDIWSWQVLGTLLRIEELQMLPDGRSLIQAVGVRKFRILSTGRIWERSY